MSLLRRLASVGLGRREEDPIGAGPPARPTERVAPRSAQQQPAQPRQAPPQPRTAAPPPRPAAAQAEGLYRPRAGDLDQHGRPQATRPQDDELEIPAFLRRQAN